MGLGRPCIISGSEGDLEILAGNAVLSALRP
jgi:hypothetical protein